MTNEKTRVCPRCRQPLTADAYPSTPSSPFFPGHRAIICTSCLEKMVPHDNWDEVDRLMRWLDLPFDIEQWARLSKLHGDRTLTAYLRLFYEGEYAAQSWRAENDKWKAARDANALLAALPDIQESQKTQYKRLWGDSYELEDYVALQDLYDKVCATQNVSTPILQQYARDLCELSLCITKKIRRGDDAKKEMDSRNNIIKVAGFEAKNAINVCDFDSVGELMLYFEKKDWQPSWATEQKDIVDATMHNIQQYLQRLVAGEGGIAERVEARRDAFNTAKRLEDADLDFKTYEDNVENIDYEGDDDLAYEINEWDV